VSAAPTGMPRSGPPESAAAGSVRARRVIASYPAYPEAEAAVERLTRAGFPVEHVAIVGRGLQYVEQVTGRIDWGRAALQGAMSGAIIGALIGWLFGVFDWFTPTVAAGWLALDGLWFGAVAGALLGLTGRALVRGRHEFSSVGSMTAERFELLVDDELADEALRLLGGPSPTAD
jgi:hypothetical protein